MAKKKIKSKKISPATSNGDLPEASLAPPPTGARRPTISLCMMVKNEEKRLPTALKSAAPWMDEIIVVDTGSTDQTVAIAQSFGAKIYHHPWEHSFSKHRNQTIQYATCDWLFILDADEELDPSSAHLLRQAVYDTQVNVYFVELYNQLKDGGEAFILHPRLFRNHLGFHYEGQVHNRPIFQGPGAKLPVRLIHYGYAEDPETMERKHYRRLEMIRRWVEQEPQNYIARAYLSQTLLEKADTLEEAVAEGQKGLELARQQGAPDVNLPRIYYPLLNALAVLNRDEETLRYALECQQASPIYTDAPFFEAWSHYVRQRWQQACQASQRFLYLQERTRTHPEEYIYFENLTLNRIASALVRWAVAAAHLGQEDEVMRLMERILPENDAENSVKDLLNTLLGCGFVTLAARLAERLPGLRPQWDWPAQAAQAASRLLGSQDLGQLKAQGLQALQNQDLASAQSLLERVLAGNEQDHEALLALGQIHYQGGRLEQAETRLVQGLAVHPGFPWAWQRLAEISLSRGDQAGALAYAQRCLTLAPADAQLQARVEDLRRQAATQPAAPTVAEQPPKLLVFLVGGLSPEMVRMPTPHFLMHRAWGELTYGLEEAGTNLPAWASLYTGQPAAAHGLTQEGDRRQPRGLADLKVPSLWQIMAQRYRVGMLAAPLGHPAPPEFAWSVAGHPAGLLAPELVRPPQLLPRLMTLGYRPDFVQSDLEERTLAQRLQRDVRQEAYLFQSERNKIAAALSLPAVEVLVVGLTALDYFQQAFGIAHYHTFTAYQQVYAIIETLLASLRPAHFAVLSQRGYAPQESQPRGLGFYCLSWLKGENGRAPAREIAPQLLRLMELDPGLLGQG